MTILLFVIVDDTSKFHQPESDSLSLNRDHDLVTAPKPGVPYWRPESPIERFRVRSLSFPRIESRESKAEILASSEKPAGVGALILAPTA